MAFSSIIRALGRSPLTTELLSKLNHTAGMRLNGIPRLPKLVASALAQTEGRNLLVVCATLRKLGWAAQLEAMGWQTVHFTPPPRRHPTNHLTQKLR